MYYINTLQRKSGISSVPLFNRVEESVLVSSFNPFPPLSGALIPVRGSGSGEVPPEAFMALPGPSKELAVATVTYINYPSRTKP